MESTRELWEKLAELPGGQKDPFDDPYGPTADCFSDNDIVRMFRLGAETRTVQHLSSCKDCQGRVDAFARVTGQETAHARATAPLPLGVQPAQQRSWLGTLFGTRAEAANLISPIRGRTLIYVPSQCVVKLDEGKVDSVRVQLITKESNALRQMKVYLRGPFSAESQVIVVDGSGYPSVELHNVKASKEVLQSLRGHMRLTKLLEVRVGTSVDDTRFVGTSNVELTRADVVPVAR